MTDDNETFENVLINKYKNNDLLLSESEKSHIFDYFKEKQREKEKTARETSLFFQLGKYLNSENKIVIIF